MRAAKKSVSIRIIPRPNGIVGVTVQHCRTGCGQTLLYSLDDLELLHIDGVGMNIDHVLQAL